MNRFSALAVLAATGLTAAAGANVVSYYNFNAGVGSGTAAPLTINASNSNGTAVSNAAANTTVYFTGTTINDLNGDGADNDYAIQNGSNGANNGSTWTFSLDTTNYEDLNLSFAVRRTSSGFNAAAIEYFDGTNWVNAGSVSYSGTAYSSNSLDLSSIAAIENNASAQVRFVFSGGSTTSSSGNNRFDNVYFEGTEVPAPGALALAGMGFVAAVRRRR